MQALRHFDEVGVCNDIWEALESLNEYDYFCFFNPDIDDEPCTEFDLIYNIEELSR